MKPLFQSSLLTATLLASLLFAGVWIFHLSWDRGPYQGIFVSLPLHEPAGYNCGDDSPIFIEVLSHDSITINHTPIKFELLRERLRDIYALRAERILYVSGSSGAEAGDLIRVMDVARGKVRDLHIVLLTPKAEQEPCHVINVAPLRTHPKLPDTD